MLGNLKNSAVATEVEKVSSHFNPKECSNHCITAFISHASKVMFKILQARLQQNFQVYKLDLEKAEESEIKLPTSVVGSQKKQKNSRKTSISASLTRLKPLTVWITTNSGKLFKRWEYQTTLPEKPVCRFFSQNWTWNTDWFKIGKGLHQGCILSPCLFNISVEYIM